MECVLLHILDWWTNRALELFVENALGGVSSLPDLCFCPVHSSVGISVDMKFCHSDSKVMYIGAIWSKPDA